MITNTPPSGLVDTDGKPLTPSRPEPKPKPCRLKWRDLYGWDATVATRRVPGLLDIHGKEMEEQLPFPQSYTKTFTHAPRSIILGAATRGGVASTWDPAKTKRQAKRLAQTRKVRYMVWHDRSLRRIDKLIKKQFAGMTKEQRAEFINQAMKGQGAATGAV